MFVLNDNFSFSIFIPIRQWLPCAPATPAEMKSPKCHSTALRSMVSCVNRYCNFKPFTSPTSRRGWVNTFYCPMLIFSSLLLSTATALLPSTSIRITPEEGGSLLQRCLKLCLQISPNFLSLNMSTLVLKSSKRRKLFPKQARCKFVCL